MLIEVLIGMLLFLIGIVGIIGLQAATMKSTTDAKYRTEATYLANAIIGKMWANTSNLGAFALPAGTVVACPADPSATERDKWVCEVQKLLPNATGANSPTIDVAGATVTITIQWKKDNADVSETVHNHVIVTDISSM